MEPTPSEYQEYLELLQSKAMEGPLHVVQLAEDHGRDVYLEAHDLDLISPRLSKDRSFLDKVVTVGFRTEPVLQKWDADRVVDFLCEATAAMSVLQGSGVRNPRRLTFYSTRAIVPCQKPKLVAPYRIATLEFIPNQVILRFIDPDNDAYDHILTARNNSAGCFELSKSPLDHYYKQIKRFNALHHQLLKLFCRIVQLGFPSPDVRLVSFARETLVDGTEVSLKILDFQAPYADAWARHFYQACLRVVQQVQSQPFAVDAGPAASDPQPQAAATSSFTNPFANIVEEYSWMASASVSHALPGDLVAPPQDRAASTAGDFLGLNFDTFLENYEGGGDGDNYSISSSQCLSGSASPLRQFLHERQAPSVPAPNESPFTFDAPDVTDVSPQHEATAPPASTPQEPAAPSASTPQEPTAPPASPPQEPTAPPLFVTTQTANVEPTSAIVVPSPRRGDSARFRVQDKLDFTQAMATVSIPVDEASIRGVCAFASSGVAGTGVLTPASALGQTLSALHVYSPTPGAFFQEADGSPCSPPVAASPSGQLQQRRSLASAPNLKRSLGTPAEKDETITSPHPSSKRRVVASSCEALRLGISSILASAFETQGDALLLRSMELRHFVGQLFEKTRDVDTDAFPVGKLLDTYVNDVTKVFMERSCGSVESTLDFVAKYVARY
jgi:hypothetical protein